MLPIWPRSSPYFEVFDFSDLHFCFDNSKGSGIAKQNTDDEQHVEWAEICVCSRRHYKYYTYTLLRRIWRGSQCKKKNRDHFIVGLLHGESKFHTFWSIWYHHYCMSCCTANNWFIIFLFPKGLLKKPTVKSKWCMYSRLHTKTTLFGYLLVPFINYCVHGV